MDEKSLIELAIAATEKAYAPYSGCHVGAALICEDGTVYTGCNIENASFTPTVCAERTAIFKAVSDGRRRFSAIAVAATKNGVIQDGFTPCGVCRQVLAEFCNVDFKVLVASGEGFEVLTLNDLLPHSFGKDRVL